MAEMTVEGRRVYIRTVYGEACVPALKAIPCHWDGSRWWCSATKQADVEKVLRETVNKPVEREDPSSIQILGKSIYKGRTYYIRWYGIVPKSNEYKARLVSLDGKLDFWVFIGPHGATIDTKYEKPKSLATLQRFVEKMKRLEAEGQDPPVPGCSECRNLGHMCERCRFDEFDN